MIRGRKKKTEKSNILAVTGECLKKKSSAAKSLKKMKSDKTHHVHGFGIHMSLEVTFTRIISVEQWGWNHIAVG